MKRQQRTAAVLVVICLVLGAAVYLLVFNRPAAEPLPAIYPLGDVRMAAVARLTVRGADATVRLERNEMGSWNMVEPFSAPADQDRVVWWIEELLRTEVSRAFDLQELDLAEVGLLTPTATIELGLAGGESRLLEVGTMEPRGLFYYVRLGDAVYLFPWDTVDRATRFLSILPLPVEELKKTPLASPSGATPTSTTAP